MAKPRRPAEPRAGRLRRAGASRRGRLRRRVRGDRRPRARRRSSREFEAAHDDYSAILAKALADRLAEAFAERLHELVRRELWGYAPDEALSNADLIAERYQGIRPAPGYPACPDHTEKGTLFELLDAEPRAGIRLTESFAMLPGGGGQRLLLLAPRSAYFGLGRIGRDQLEDYAARKGRPVEDAARWLAPNLAEEPAG